VDTLKITPQKPLNLYFVILEDKLDKFGVHFTGSITVALNKKRAKVFDEAKTKGYKLISYVHPTTSISEEFHMGENCFIFEKNVIQPFVTLGNDIIIWTGNVISHHTTIKDHCFIVSHSAIAGNVTINSFCFIGMNATIRNGIKIAKETVIGAGAIILNDTEEKGVYTNKSTIKLDITSDKLKSI
jgi:sugar O-acyltransferase (sialic acid O-acetyltransferase NeuD family)